MSSNGSNGSNENHYNTLLLNYISIPPIKHFKIKPELQLRAVARVFRVFITGYYYILLVITSNYYHYFHYFHYFPLPSLVMGSNRAVMG